MPNSNNQNSLLDIKIEEIKNSNASTKQMYIQAAKILFLQFQEMPTANRLYSLIKKGSMTTVVEAMKIFWQDIQHQLEIKVEMPNIPAELHTKMVEQMESIWQQAIQQAANLFDIEKENFIQKINHYEQEINNQVTKYQQIEEKYQNQQLELSNLQELNKKLTIEKENLFVGIETLNSENKQQAYNFQQQINNLQIQHTQQLQNLQQDIKVWQQKLDNERTYFRQIEKDLHIQNKILSNEVSDLTKNLHEQKQLNLSIQNQFSFLQDKYNKLEEQFNKYKLTNSNNINIDKKENMFKIKTAAKITTIKHNFKKRYKK